MLIENMGNKMYNAFHRGTLSHGVGDTHFEAIKKCLSMVHEKLFEEFTEFLEDNGSDYHSIRFLDYGIFYEVNGDEENGEKSHLVPLPIKYLQFVK